MSLFKAIFVIPCEDRKNVAQDLLHFITVRTAIASGHKPYLKILALGWESFFQNPKKLTDEATSTEPILYEGIEKVKQFMGDLLKSRQLSTYVHINLLSFFQPFNFSQFSNLFEFRVSSHNRAIDILSSNYDKSISV